MQSLIRYGLSSLAGGNAPLETLQIDQAVVGILSPALNWAFTPSGVLSTTFRASSYRASA